MKKNNKKSKDNINKLVNSSSFMISMIAGCLAILLIIYFGVTLSSKGTYSASVTNYCKSPAENLSLDGTKCNYFCEVTTGIMLQFSISTNEEFIQYCKQSHYNLYGITYDSCERAGLGNNYNCTRSSDECNGTVSNNTCASTTTTKTTYTATIYDTNTGTQIVTCDVTGSALTCETAVVDAGHINGKEFLYWVDKDDDTVISNNDSTSFELGRNRNIRAIWKDVSSGGDDTGSECTLNLYNTGNGLVHKTCTTSNGSCSFDNDESLYGTIEGKTFKGWSVSGTNCAATTNGDTLTCSGGTKAFWACWDDNVSSSNTCTDGEYRFFTCDDGNSGWGCKLIGYNAVTYYTGTDCQTPYGCTNDPSCEGTTPVTPSPSSSSDPKPSSSEPKPSSSSQPEYSDTINANRCYNNTMVYVRECQPESVDGAKCRTSSGDEILRKNLIEDLTKCSGSSSPSSQPSNPDTGTAGIVIAWIIGIIAIGYSFYYFKKMNSLS